MKRLFASVLLVAIAFGALISRRCDLDSDCCVIDSVSNRYQRHVCMNGTCMEMPAAAMCYGNQDTADQMCQSLSIPWWTCPVAKPVVARCDLSSLTCVFASVTPPVLVANPGQCPACWEFAPYTTTGCVGWGTCLPILDCCCVDTDCELCHVCDKKTGLCVRKDDCCTSNVDCERSRGDDPERMCDLPRCVLTSEFEGVCVVGESTTNVACMDNSVGTYDSGTPCGCCHVPRFDDDECIDDADCRGWDRNVGQLCVEDPTTARMSCTLGPRPLNTNCNRPEQCPTGTICCGGGKCSKEDGKCPPGRADNCGE
jgi:hypothetical protein